jgi:hypothetical protein
MSMFQRRYHETLENILYTIARHAARPDCRAEPFPRDVPSETLVRWTVEPFSVTDGSNVNAPTLLIDLFMVSSSLLSRDFVSKLTFEQRHNRAFRSRFEMVEQSIGKVQYVLEDRDMIGLHVSR